MTGHEIEAHFGRLGMTPEEASSRAALFALVESGFRSRFNGPPRWRWFVPGRIEIFGKHTDYAGGRSLLAAVPRGMAVVARPRADDMVQVADIRDGQLIQVHATDERTDLRGLASYVQVVARRFDRNFPGAALGVDLAIASDLPLAAGLSSSSALVVGIAAALARRGALAEREEWQRHIATVQDLAWYLGSVENGLDYRGLPGSAGVGTLGGSEDHTAILACRAEHVSQYSFVPVTHVGDRTMPDQWAFVVATSGVRADKAGSVREHYNRAARSARGLLDLWNARAPSPARSLGHALSSGPDAVDQLRQWLTSPLPGAFSEDDLGRRLRHFVHEDRRVPDAAEAFASADSAAIGALAADSQRDAHDLLGNQVPETRELAALARDAGAWASSSFGAGFGGSVWALVAASDSGQFAEEWVAAYRARMPGVRGVEYFVARPGPPLTELPG